MNIIYIIPTCILNIALLLQSQYHYMKYSITSAYKIKVIKVN